MLKTTDNRRIPKVAALTTAVIATITMLGTGGPAFAQATRASADFNGDDVADLAVGAPGADGGKGSVSVFLGVRNYGLEATPTWTFSGTANGENYGAAIATGDLNDDGLSELIIGAPEWNQGRGRVRVVRFVRQTTGLPRTTFAWVYQGVSNAAGVQSAGNRFGAVLVTGHFDRDRFGDVAAGVPGYDNGAIDAGAVHIFYGDSFLFNFNRDELWHLGRGELSVGDSIPAIERIPRASDLFGSALSAADFDRDGFDDLAIGIPLRDRLNTQDNEGAVLVIYGTPAGLRLYRREFRSEFVNFIGTERAGDELGLALTTGDFDRDGYPDLAVGAPFGNFPGRPRSGYVMIKYGSFQGLFSMFFLEPQYAGLVQLNGLFGLSLAAADFTGDGYEDLAVGAPNEDVGAVADAGVVIVFYGGERYYFDPGHVFHQDSFGVADRSESFDWFGRALATGDFDKDGLADLAIGVPYENREGTTTIRDVGAVAVLTGYPSVLDSGRSFYLLPAARLADGKFGAALSQ